LAQVFKIKRLLSSQGRLHSLSRMPSASARASSKGHSIGGKVNAGLLESKKGSALGLQGGAKGDGSINLGVGRIGYGAEAKGQSGVRFGKDHVGGGAGASAWAKDTLTIGDKKNGVKGEISVGAEMSGDGQLGRHTKGALTLACGVRGGAAATGGNGGKVSGGFARNAGFGVGAEAGVNDKGSSVVGAEAAGFGGGVSLGGDHLIGGKVKAFGFDVALQIPKLW